MGSALIKKRDSPRLSPGFCAALSYVVFNGKFRYLPYAAFLVTSQNAAAQQLVSRIPAYVHHVAHFVDSYHIVIIAEHYMRLLIIYYLFVIFHLLFYIPDNTLFRYAPCLVTAESFYPAFIQQSVCLARTYMKHNAYFGYRQYIS